MIRDRSVVQRLNPKNVFGPVEYLCRREALFAEDEWYWDEDRELAFVFDSHAEADAATVNHWYELADAAPDHRATRLKPYAAVCGSDQLRAEAERRHTNRLAGIEASIPSERVYAETARRLGEHD